MAIEKIAVVGTGLMGKGIAHTFAGHGFKVNLFGRRDETKNEFCRYIDNEVKKGRTDEEQRDIILSNVCFHNIKTQAVNLSDCDLIIETVSEDMETKKEVLKAIAEHSKDETIIASNTSSYSITLLSQFTHNPDNFIGMHFFSPVPLMKLVEIAKGHKTSHEAAEKVCGLVRSIGKMPALVKDTPAFVLNRGLLVMINEAVFMRDEQIAESEVIDNIFINGMGMKVGPLKMADLIGIDVIYASISNMYERFTDKKYLPCPLLGRMTEAGKIGRKSGEGFYKY